jgi:hypothetical protein
MARSITKILQKIVTGTYRPDTGRTIELKTDVASPVLVATATESPAASGQYVITWTEAAAYGYFYLDTVQKTSWGKVWLGHEAGDINLSSTITYLSGSVGINITAPTSPLHVVGASYLNGATVVNGNLQVTGSALVTNDITTENAVFAVGARTTSPVTPAIVMEMVSATRAQIRTFDNVPLTIQGDAGGFVSINKPTATVPFDVSGSTIITGSFTTTGAAIIGGNTTITGSLIVTTDVTSPIFATSLAPYITAIDGKELYVGSTGGIGGHLTLIKGSSGDQVFKVSVATSGDPGQTLQILGAGGSSPGAGGNLKLSGGPGDTNGNVLLNISGSTVVGKTAIGKSTANAQFDVSGSTSITGSLNVSGSAIFEAGNVTVSGSIYNSDIVYPSISSTVANPVVITIKVPKLDGMDTTRNRHLASWWISDTDFGAGGLLTAADAQTLAIVSGSIIASGSALPLNLVAKATGLQHTLTNNNELVVLTITPTAPSDNYTIAYIMAEVQGIVYSHGFSYDNGSG